MKQISNVLYNYNVPLYEEDNFRKLLDNINSLNKDLKSEVNICRYSHNASFEKYSTYVSTVLLRLFPETQTSSGSYGQRQKINSDGRGLRGGRGGIFEGRGG